MDDLQEMQRALSLSDSDVAHLRRQGFVSQQRRGGVAVYKLRFRIAGRQHIRWLGRDLARATQVSDFLRRLRTKRKATLAIRHVLRDGRRQLRRLRVTHASIFLEAGLRFHGRTLRRIRRRPEQSTSS